MKRKATTLALISALLLSAIAGMLLIGIGVADPYIAPEEAPLGYRIYSDGTYDVPNLRQDGNTYTLTGDVEGTIVVERDGIVLDGANYTLSGKGVSFGVWLQDRNGVTIKNLNIQHFDHGIRFSHYAPDWHSGHTNPNYTTNCAIELCTITDNDNGISFYWGISDCNILGNYVANNTYGITFAGSGNTFRNNKLEGNQYDFWDQDDGDNDVDASNTVDGKPICYWVNQHNQTVPKNAGLVILKHCSGIKVQNLSLTGQRDGLTLYYTNNSIITGNNISDNYWRGIAVWWSSNNSIIGNQITNTAHDGIEEYESHSNTISHNLITANKGVGIYHRTLITNEVISGNQIIANQGGGISGDSTNCTITNNYIFGNQGDAVSTGEDCVVMETTLLGTQGLE